MEEIKKLIKKQREEYVRIATYTNEYGYLHKIPKYKDVWNWHKQSLKQFIDELIARENDKCPKLINREITHQSYNDGKRDAIDDTISHLKERKENLTNQPPL